MLKSIRVLWLDSDDHIVASGKQVLVEQGWIVDQAHNLVDALDRISRGPYDAVILDLQLPDTLGTDAWIHIRKLQPNIIGVMTTSSASLLHLVRVDSPGLTDYVPKPLTMPHIVKTIYDALGINELPSETETTLTCDPHTQ